MMRPTRAWRLAAVVGVAGLALAACGGEEDPEATPSGSESSSSAEEEPAAEGDGTLTIGTLLPQTGSLASLGPPEFAGVQLAVDEINEAGGVLGQQVVKVDSDSGDTTTDIASQSTDRLLSSDADVIIGAASSAVSLNVIDTITSAGVVQISPANTSPTFTDYDDNGLFFRTAPSDVLQGAVMGDLLLNDGYTNIGLMVLDDDYGVGLAGAITESVEAGGGAIAGQVTYNPEAAGFSAEVTEMVGYGPDAIVLIGFAETAKVIPELAAQGVGPQDVPLYLVDGNIDDYNGDLPDGLLEGSKATLPGADVSGFQDRLLSVDPTLTVFSYGPEAYDATIVAALAAVAAGDDSGTAIGAALADVTREGEKCATYAECLALLEADPATDIDYDGVSGPIEFSDAGDPTEASIGIYQYDATNRYSSLEFVTRAI